MNKRENTPVTLRVLWTDVMTARKTFGNKNIIINPQSINTLHTVARFSLIHSFFYFSIVILLLTEWTVSMTYLPDSRARQNLKHRSVFDLVETAQ